MSDNFGRNRNSVIIGLVIAVLAVMLLAISLRSSEWAVIANQAVVFEPELADLGDPMELPSLEFPLSIIMLMIIALSIISVLRYPMYTLRMMILTAIAVTLISQIIERQPDAPPNTSEETSGELLLEELVQSDLETVYIEAAPDWFTSTAAFVLSFMIVLLLAAIIIFLIHHQWGGSAVVLPPSEEIVEQAQAALDQIDAGHDLRDTILNCYVQMLETVREQRGITRGVSMTAHEFENELIKLGLPNSAVQRLTRLFETVRYGSQALGVREQHEARDCLNEIVAAVAS